MLVLNQIQHLVVKAKREIGTLLHMRQVNNTCETLYIQRPEFWLYAPNLDLVACTLKFPSLLDFRDGMSGVSFVLQVTLKVAWLHYLIVLHKTSYLHLATRHK